MALQLIKCGPEVPAGCEDIFRNSEIYTRYFQDGRLGRSLERYAQNGELYLACDESGRPLGAMKVSNCATMFLMSAVEAVVALRV